MIFNTSKCQDIFRNRFTGPTGIPFKDFKSGSTIRDQLVDPSDLALYRSAKSNDIIHFYYKSLLSFSEGLAACLRQNYTWATIKLYYSVYFGLRCSLLCRDIVLVRAARHLYKLKLIAGAQYEKPDDMTDHGGTIKTYVDLFNRTDFFCSNPLEGVNSYMWLKDCREIVNYRDDIFHDPDTTVLWDSISKEIAARGSKMVLTDFVNDKGKYCFLPDFAVLAIPMNRVLILAQEVKNEISDRLEPSQKEWIRDILQNHTPQEYIGAMLLED